MAASHGVTPFLEALGSDVAAGLGSPLPPRRSGALGVFRHLLVSPLLARRARPLPRTWDHLQRPVPETAPFTRALRQRTPWRLPWSFWPVQRSRKRESDSRSKVPPFDACPSRRFSRPQGIDPLSTVPSFSEGWHSAGFPPFRAFVPSKHLPQLVAGHPLLDVSHRLDRGCPSASESVPRFPIGPVDATPSRV